VSLLLVSLPLSISLSIEKAVCYSEEKRKRNVYEEKAAPCHGEKGEEEEERRRERGGGERGCASLRMCASSGRDVAACDMLLLLPSSCFMKRERRGRREKREILPERIEGRYYDLSTASAWLNALTAKHCCSVSRENVKTIGGWLAAGSWRSWQTRSGRRRRTHGRRVSAVRKRQCDGGHTCGMPNVTAAQLRRRRATLARKHLKAAAGRRSRGAAGRTAGAESGTAGGESGSAA